MSEVTIRNGSGAFSIPTADAMAALTEIVSAAREYNQIREVEQTKRADIAAEEHVQVERINAAEGILREYFDRVFAERAQTNKELFSRLDTAMESGDPQMVHAVVRGIVDLAQSSPLAGIEDFGKFWAELGTSTKPVEL